MNRPVVWPILVAMLIAFAVAIAWRSTGTSSNGSAFVPRLPQSAALTVSVPGSLT